MIEEFDPNFKHNCTFSPFLISRTKTLVVQKVILKCSGFNDFLINLAHDLSDVDLNEILCIGIMQQFVEFIFPM